VRLRDVVGTKCPSRRHRETSETTSPERSIAGAQAQSGAVFPVARARGGL